jgi:hypothetical protein
MIMKYGIKYLFILIWLSGCSLVASGQNFIGLNSSEIAALMRSSYPDFKLDKNAVNHSYKYQKYVDKISEQTVLFFMTDRDECSYVRWMSDYSNLNDIIETLNRKYKKNGSNSWCFTEKGENYGITLVEEEWYFTVSYRKN